MLSHEENQLLTQVGPGTPMGELFRRFWIPVLLAAELPRSDSDPVRARILGEDLIAFAIPAAGSACWPTTARIAARRCSSAATRKAACAASTTAGSSTSAAHCVDMPNEPAESDFKAQGSARRRTQPSSAAA